VLDFSIDTSGTLQDVQRRQKMADALLQEGMNTTPAAGGKYGGWLTAANRALAGALGGYQSGQLGNQERAGLAASARNFSSGLSGGTVGEPDSTPGNPPLATGVPMGMVKPGMPQPDTSEKVYTQDQLNPMDEPRGDARTKMIATLLGEEKPGSPESLGAANVIRNRAVDGGYGGDTPDAVVQSPNQFSPWNDQSGRDRMSRALQDPAQVAKANDTIDQTYGVGKYAAAGPNDPTEGKTHFYDPASMVPPNSVPKWAQGKQGQQIGKTLFFDDPNDSQTPPNAQMAKGQLPSRPIAQGPQVAQNGPANVNVRNWANSVLNDPYANPSQKQVAASVLQKTITPKEDAWSSAGNGYVMNSRTGEVRKGYESDDKKPASVADSDEAGIASPFRCRIVPSDRAKSATHGAKDRALRHTRRAPCRSSSSPPHACSRTREAQSDRCPYARCSDCAEAPWVASAVASSTAVPAFSGAISADLPHACADPPRSPDGAPTASNLPSKDRVSGSSAPRQERFHTRPQHGSTRTGCRPLPRNDEVPSEILPVQQENQRARNGTRTKYQKDVQDSDAYEDRPWKAR
jgi:hypothetical protein